MDTKEVIEPVEGLLLIPEREVNYSWPEERQIVKRHEEYLALRQSVHELLSALKQSQAKVDALMFECCPDDMTAEQIHAYGVAQSERTERVT